MEIKKINDKIEFETEVQKKKPELSNDHFTCGRGCTKTVYNSITRSYEVINFTQVALPH